ncbi:zinc-ribbon domain containing protein [Candidatus Gottesmanbacteria bacterium]|nr:zinc-ribbon domain containing protein [Candidatus Gottesmanbacteria bacterium]
MSNFSDQNLTCRDCGAQFVWTAGEQEFYQQKGFTNPPTRCKDCRAKKKTNFNSGGSRQMYDATCGRCGKPCQVPFQPRGDKPVYCSECFRSMRG